MDKVLPRPTGESPTPIVQTPSNIGADCDRDELASLIDEDDAAEEKHGPIEEEDDKLQAADIIEIETSQSADYLGTAVPSKMPLDRATRLNDPLRYSHIARTAEIAIGAKNDGVARRLRGSGDGEAKRGGEKDRRRGPRDASISLDNDVATVDRLLTRTSRAVLLCWIALVLLAYCIVPPGSIQRYEGAERSAALVELSGLGAAVAARHLPLLWETNLMGASSSSMLEVRGRRRAKMGEHTQLSGVLVGGMVTQLIALATAAIMVFFPVPVMVDPILGSRVHFIRWAEWAPLAGYMTLITECIDAPVYDGEKLAHPWRKKFVVSATASLSTLCGYLFPFCTNAYVWSAVMIFSLVAYSIILFRYAEKRRLFRSCVWRGGGSVDEIELYERSRISLALLGMCCIVWTLITLAYFVASAGHLFVPESWTLLHDRSATMIGECIMDFVAKCLYMAFILEAHHIAFDESKRVHRRLTELRNTMNVVWENSSDTIAISVQKASGNVTSMVSPSFFRQALTPLLRQGNIEDISAVILEHRDIAVRSKKGSTTDISRIKEDELPDVGIRIVRKAHFADVDLSSAASGEPLEYRGRKDEAMTPPVVAFADMMARAWQCASDESLFEHDAVVDGGSAGTKFEVKVTRPEGNALVAVVRNVSERHRRFEAEKRFVFETTARQKDVEANRFTRHEVKNGILAAIEICGNVQEKLLDDLGAFRKGQPKVNDSLISEESIAGRMKNMAELDTTLHEVLNIVLAETMAKDVIHGMYVPQSERIDMSQILTQTRGFAHGSQFSVIFEPTPFPILSSDQGLFKCIHGNAIRNAVKYGKPGGKITTEVIYNPKKGELNMKVINSPGPGHAKLVAMGSRASDLVFAHGTSLHKDSDMGKRLFSAGDGAWIVRKCAKILGGEVGMTFESDRTVFCLNAPVKVHDSSTKDADAFQLPPGVWGIGIDDSKIQRKLLRRFFVHAGVQEYRQIILGQDTDEITGFVDFFVNFVNGHPGDRILLIADENLEVDSPAGSHETVSGSKCIKQIRNALDPKQEKRILALVRSANDSPQDLALYRSRAHGYTPKVPLQGMSVRETVSALWNERFPAKAEEDQEEDNLEGTLTPAASLENLRDLTLISPIELLVELEEIDSLCVQNRTASPHDQWPVIWDKLHQLKGDLKSVNHDSKFSRTIDLIESLKGVSCPSDFMSTWLQIRADVVSLISQG